MIITKLTDEYIEDEEVYSLFPEFYMGHSSKGFDNNHANWETKGRDEGYMTVDKAREGGDVTVVAPKPEVDEVTGLEIVPKESVYSKYGINLDPNKSSFHKSLYDQFEAKGYLSTKQVNAIKNSRN